MKKQILLCFMLIFVAKLSAQSLTIDSAPLSVAVGDAINVTVSFDAGSGDTATGNIVIILREYDTSVDPETNVWKNAGNVASGNTQSGTVMSSGLEAPNGLTPSADLDPGKEYRIVVIMNRSVGSQMLTQQVLTITEGPNIKYTSIPTEVSSITGNGLGKGTLKTIVTWSNVTPGSTMFNQLRDHTGTLDNDDQVGGYSFVVNTANGSQELVWNYFGAGALVAGNTAFINSNYSSLNANQTVNVVNDITRWTADAATTDWDTAGNWDNGAPTGSLKAVVPNLASDPIASGAITAAEVTLQEGAALTVSGAITSPIVTLQSGTSLTAASVSGTVTYNRTLSTPDLTGVSATDNLAGWHLVSSPVSSETYDDTWVSNNGIAYGAGSNRGIATYNNAVASNNWSYAQAPVASTSFGEGVGYSMKRINSGEVTFSGSYRGSNITDIALTKNTSAYNLVGNPFSAFVSATDLFTANDSGGNDLLTSSTIWVWNATSKAYEAKIGGFQIAPGQGFFVETTAAASTFTINTSMLSHQTDTFLKSAKTEIQLNITDGDLTRYAKVSYLDNTTSGFDNGFDGKLFGGVAQPFAVYTHLLNDNNGTKYQLQALPSNNLESMVVPVGVNAAAGKEITFSAEALNLPSGLKVFLEDRVNNTFTRLDEANSDLKVTLTEALNGTGRFYLHTRSSALSVSDDALLGSVSIFKSAASTLRIAGLSQGKANVKLYNILGKKVMETSFNTNGVQDISLPKLATGIYIVQLETETGKLNKKITLE